MFIPSHSYPNALTTWPFLSCLSYKFLLHISSSFYILSQSHSHTPPYFHPHPNILTDLTFIYILFWDPHPHPHPHPPPTLIHNLFLIFVVLLYKRIFSCIYNNYFMTQLSYLLQLENSSPELCWLQGPIWMKYWTYWLTKVQERLTVSTLT